MSRINSDFVALGDIAAGLGLLSRMPVPVDFERAQARGARAAWAWPLAGVLIGAIAAAAGSAALWLGLAPGLAAALSLACLIGVTGAMHEDGLADCADGFWGGWDRDRRLAIMKDSHIGAYGVLAIAIAVLLRWQAMTVLFGEGIVWSALIAAACLSRTPMVALMTVLPPARDDGLSRAVGRPAPEVALLAACIALAVCLFVAGVSGLAAFGAVALVGLGWAAICRAKIGGQTGDTLGAVQQLTEIAALLVLTILLTPP